MTDDDNLRLRAIAVSTQAALDSLFSADDAEQIRTRARELLADLRADVLKDGADPHILAEIAAAERAMED